MIKFKLRLMLRFLELLLRMKGITKWQDLVQMK